MKNILIATNITSLILSLVLLFLFIDMRSKQSHQTIPNDIIKSNKAKDYSNIYDYKISESNSVNKIGYVDVERFQNKSLLFQELKRKLEKKQSNFKQKMQQKVESLEQKINRFKTNASSLSQFEIQVKQQELAKEEKEIYVLEQELQSKFQNEQNRLNKQLLDALNQYLSENYKDNDYSMIIGNTLLGATIIKSSKEIELTDSIIKGMNSLYKKEK